MSFEHAVLLGGRQPAVQGQDFQAVPVRLGERLRGVLHLTLAGQEDEDVPLSLTAQLVHRVADRLHLVRRAGVVPGGTGTVPVRAGVVIVVAVIERRTVPDLDGVGPPRHLDHGRLAKMLREPPGVDGGGGDDDLEVGTRRQEPFEVTKDEIDVEATLVRLVDYERVVGAEIGAPCSSASNTPSVISLTSVPSLTRSVKRTL